MLLALPLAMAVLLPPETVPLVVVDDLTDVEHTPFDQANAGTVINDILAAYEETGQPLPEILSVWTAFPFNDNVVETRFIPVGNDVTGIGLENAFGEGEEVFDQYPPLRAMLIHNDVTELRARADLERLADLDVQPFGEYLFLLELSHVWGPEIFLADAPQNRLIGFDFHFSFFLDHPSGGVVGGNTWIDNGDGTFTVAPVDYAALTFAPLELYLMGLAPASEIAPFGLLTDVEVPAGAIDPFTNRAVSAASFPWQGPDALTVTATREEITIDDVVAHNGARSPAFGVSPTSFTLGIVLLVPFGITTEERNQLTRDFVPLARGLAPAFARATGNRGSLEPITSTEAPPPAPVDIPDEGEGEGEDGGEGEDDGGESCVQASPGTWISAVALVLKRKKRRVTTVVRASHPVPRLR